MPLSFATLFQKYAVTVLLPHDNTIYVLEIMFMYSVHEDSVEYLVMLLGKLWNLNFRGVISFFKKET